MSAPAPAIVNVPLEYDALPVTPTLPTSAVTQGDGTLPLGGGGGGGGGPLGVPDVVNDHVGDSATIDEFFTVAFVRETTFQEYVVPVASDDDGVHEYVDGGLFTSCAGTLPASDIPDEDGPR